MADLSIVFGTIGASQMISDLTRLEGKALSLSGVFSTVAANLASPASIAAIGTIIKDVVTDSIEAFADFEQSIADLQAITGAAGSDLEYFKNQARELGIEVEGGATAAAKAFELIGSAKPELLENSAALAQLTKDAVLFSQASGLQLPEAATALTDALNQFKAPASEAVYYMDTLAAGAKYGAAAIPEATQALLRFGAGAKAFNVDIRESTAAIQLFSLQGLKGAEAGTAMRNILLKMQGVKGLGKEALEGLARARVDISKVSDASIPLIDRLREMGKAFNDEVAPIKVFGTENVNAAQILFGSLDRYEELAKQVGEVGGAAEAAAIRTKTLAHQFRTIKNAAGDALISIGNVIGPVIGGIVRFAKENSLLLESMLKATVVVGGLALAWKAYNVVVALTPSILAAANAATITLQAAYIALTGSTNLAAGAMKAFQIIMASNPVGLAVTAIAALTAGLYFLTKNSNEATEAQKRFQAATKLIDDAVAAANVQIGKEIFALDQSIKKLGEENTTKGQKLKITNDIIAKYGQYLSDLDKEKIKAGEVATAYTKIKEAIIVSVNARQKSEAINNLLDEQLKVQRDAAANIGKAFGQTALEVVELANQFKTLSPEIQQLVLDGEHLKVSMSGQFTELQKQSVELFGRVVKEAKRGAENVRKQGLDPMMNSWGNALNNLVSSTTLIDVGLAEIEKRFGGVGESAEDVIGDGGTFSDGVKNAKELAEQFGFVGMAEGHLLQSAMDHMNAEKDRAAAVAATKKEIDDLAYVMAEGANQTDAMVMQVSASIPKITELQQSLISLKGTLINDIGGAFLDFAATAAFAFGEAINGGKNLGQVMSQLLVGLGSTIAKLAGMALLNASVALGPTPAALAMAIAGIGLIGLSGILSSVGKKDAARFDRGDNPQSSTTAAIPQQSSRGLDGATGNERQPYIIQIDGPNGEILSGYMRRQMRKDDIRRG